MRWLPQRTLRLFTRTLAAFREQIPAQADTAGYHPGSTADGTPLVMLRVKLIASSCHKLFAHVGSVHQAKLSSNNLLTFDGTHLDYPRIMVKEGNFGALLWK